MASKVGQPRIWQLCQPFILQCRRRIRPQTAMGHTVNKECESGPALRPCCRMSSSQATTSNLDNHETNPLPPDPANDGECWTMLTSDPTDMPVADLPNPYESPPAKCILCEQQVELDYKNVRLLSQFVSPHTGQIYGRHITGLCIYMQKRVARLIKRSRMFGYMPYILKDPKYLTDPKLFDPFKRKS